MLEVFLTCIECGWALDDEDFDVCPECDGDNREWVETDFEYGCEG